MAQFGIGDKATVPMPNGLRWPAVCVSEPTHTPTVVTNKSTNQPTTIDVIRQDFISLRETNPINPLTGEAQDVSKYLTLTTEVVQYGYRPIAEARSTNVEGLDIVEGGNGEVISLDRLKELRGEAFSAFQLTQFNLRRGATDAASLLEGEGTGTGVAAGI